MTGARPAIHSLPWYRKKPLIFSASLVLALFLIYLDGVTGPDFSFYLFYFIPVLLVAWYADLGLALVIVLVGVLIRSLFDISWTTDKRPLVLLVWKVLSRALIQSLFALLISRLRTALNRAHEARREAEQATRAKSMFLATMSHELRTPMNAILGMAELLDRSRLEVEQKAWVKVFRKEGRLLLNLLNDLLDFSKIEARQFKLEPAPFSLPGLLEELGSVLGVQAREKGLALHLPLASTLPPRIWGDAMALRRVLFNLVGNAIKFTDQGEVSVAVSRGRGSSGSELHFQVDDTGAGIPDDQRESIFAPFSQASSTASRSGGTGLGLTIVRDLLELMGGRIRVTDRPGGGSRFEFVVPLVEVAGEPPAAPPANGEPLAAAVSAPLAILIVDDYPTNRLVLKEFLKEVGCLLAEAETGLQAVQAVRGAEFSLVFMDVKMPGMDGYEALKQIRSVEAELGRTPVPVVALTAQAYPEDVRNALAAGFQAHLAKPLDRAAALSTVSEWARPLEKTPAASLPPELEAWKERYHLEVRQFLDEAVEAAAVGDTEVLERVGHRLRGSGSVFGYVELSQIGEKLETAALAGDREGAKTAVSRLADWSKAREGQR